MMLLLANLGYKNDLGLSVTGDFKMKLNRLSDIFIIQFWVVFIQAVTERSLRMAMVA